jgi:hypothetical protein
MEARIINLQHEFNGISLIRNKIINIFELLKNKMDKLKILHSDFIKNSKSQLFVFGLDSFHFQSKLIDLEYDDMNRMFLAINNRMYCEYFKLYKIIVSYISENISDKKIMEIIKGNNFPIYKDLEPFKDYKFDTILEIHENILNLLNSIISIINNRENELSLHKTKQLIGLNIDNFVNSFNFEIVVMKEKINLFLTYIEFFHKLHAKYLTRFTNKIHLMLTHINSDIHFDDNIENNSSSKNKTDNKSDGKELVKNTFNININDENHDENNEHITNTSESGLSTPSEVSFKSKQSFTSAFKIPKIIKNSFKKVNNILTGCNNVKQIENNENIDLIFFEDVYKENEVQENKNKSLSLYINEIDTSNECDINTQLLENNSELVINEFDNMHLETPVEKNIEETGITEIINTTELKSDSEYSEVTSYDSESITSIIKNEINSENISEDVKKEDSPKKRKKYKPRKKNVV